MKTCAMAISRDVWRITLRMLPLRPGNSGTRRGPSPAPGKLAQVGASALETGRRRCGKSTQQRLPAGAAFAQQPGGNQSRRSASQRRRRGPAECRRRFARPGRPVLRDRLPQLARCDAPALIADNCAREGTSRTQHTANEGLAFLPELVKLVVLDWWGATFGSGVAARVLLGIGVPGPPSGACSPLHGRGFGYR